MEYVMLKQKDLKGMCNMEIKEGRELFNLKRVRLLIGNGRAAMEYGMWIDRFTHYYTDGYFAYATKGTVEGIEAHIAPYCDNGSPLHLMSSVRAFTGLFKGVSLYTFVEEEHQITRKVLKRLGAIQNENKFTIKADRE